MKTITEVAERIASAPVETDVWRGKIPMGKHIRQGDVQLVRVSGKTPVGKILAQGENVQIAVGQNIGARHVINGADGVTVYAPVETSPLTGPIIKVKRGYKALLTHPEHRHFELSAGTYSVTFQRDFMSEEIARVSD